VWSSYRPAGRMWPATTFSVARGSIQKKSSILKFVEKHVRLHLSHSVVYLGYGRHGTCHGRHFGGGAKIASQKLKYLFKVS